MSFALTSYVIQLFLVKWRFQIKGGLNLLYIPHYSLSDNRWPCGLFSLGATNCYIRSCQVSLSVRIHSTRNLEWLLFPKAKEIHSILTRTHVHVKWGRIIFSSKIIRFLREIELYQKLGEVKSNYEYNLIHFGRKETWKISTE